MYRIRHAVLVNGHAQLLAWVVENYSVSCLLTLETGLTFSVSLLVPVDALARTAQARANGLHTSQELVVRRVAGGKRLALPDSEVLQLMSVMILPPLRFE
jgi:hypothetical protein